MKGREQCVELLLGKGAAVDQPDNAGKTPLNYAAKNGHEACAELLLGKGSAVDQPEANHNHEDGRTRQRRMTRAAWATTRLTPFRSKHGAILRGRTRES